MVKRDSADMRVPAGLDRCGDSGAVLYPSARKQLRDTALSILIGGIIRAVKVAGNNERQRSVELLIYQSKQELRLELSCAVTALEGIGVA